MSWCETHFPSTAKWPFTLVASLDCTFLIHIKTINSMSSAAGYTLVKTQFFFSVFITVYILHTSWKYVLVSYVLRNLLLYLILVCCFYVRWNLTSKSWTLRISDYGNSVCGNIILPCFFYPQWLLWRLRAKPNLSNPVLPQRFALGDSDRRQVSRISSISWISYYCYYYVHHVDVSRTGQNDFRQMRCVCRALRIWEPGRRGMVMQTKAHRDSNGLCCNYHPQGGVVATG